MKQLVEPFSSEVLEASNFTVITKPPRPPMRKVTKSLFVTLVETLKTTYLGIMASVSIFTLMIHLQPK